MKFELPGPDWQPTSDAGLDDEDYEERCDHLYPYPEYDEFDREPDDDGYVVCGGKLVVTGGHGYYNGYYQCYTMYLLCDRCGPYEVECV